MVVTVGWLALVAALRTVGWVSVVVRLYPKKADCVYCRILNVLVRYNREDLVVQEGDVDGWGWDKGDQGPGVSWRRPSFGLGCRARRLLLEEETRRLWWLWMVGGCCRSGTWTRYANLEPSRAAVA